MSTVRKQREVNAGIQLFPSFPTFFMKFKSPAKLGLPSVTPFWEPIQKCVSWVTPNSIELAEKTNPLGLHQNITWDPINMLDNYVLYQLINE